MLAVFHAATVKLSLAVRAEPGGVGSRLCPQALSVGSVTELAWAVRKSKLLRGAWRVSSLA